MQYGGLGRVASPTTATRIIRASTELASNGSLPPPSQSITLTARSQNHFPAQLSDRMRTIELALKDFPTTPQELLDSNGKPLQSITIPLKDLYHQYWQARYGSNPSGGTFEYIRQLSEGPELRMGGAGIGADTESKRNISNELGKAFARWFVYTHIGHTYFCPFETAMTRSRRSSGHKWSRREPGDLPDYVCGTDEHDINLLEAKGRYSPVSFETKEFEKFRQQLGRARLCDAAGTELAVKGFISAARWATEEKPRVKSKLWVEDPWTEGRRGDGYPLEVGYSMVLGHYVSIFRRLQLPIVADCLQFSFPLPQEIGARRGIWLCRSGPLAGAKFVGGIIPSDDVYPYWRGPYDRWDDDPFILRPPAQFFGVEARRFTSVLRAARQGPEQRISMEPLIVPEELGAISFLRDGSVLGPSSYFEPTGTTDLDG